MKFVAKIELFLVALWLGAACFFSFGVAPNLFSILPSSEMAGAVVNRTLSIVNFSGLVIGLTLILTSLIPRNDAKRFWIWLQRFLVFVMGAACGAGQLIIGIYLEHLRGLIGRPIDELAADDPLRIQFNLWHQYSVWILITAMVAALLAFFIISRSSPGSVKSPKSIPDFELPDELKM